MNTPLQHAAWAVIARWDSPLWKDMPHTSEYIDAMRKALADEQAQAVEPVAIYDIGVNEKLGAVHLLKQLKSGDKLYTHPTPPPAGERAKVGYSRFESWYSELHQSGKGSKQIVREAYEAGMNEAQQVAVPDMFWNHDDADKLYSSISEFLNDEICNGTELAIGDIRTVQRAVRLPNIDIRITSVNDEECDADYEIVEAQGANP